MRANAWVLAIDIGIKVALVALLGLALLFPDLPGLVPPRSESGG